MGLFGCRLRETLSPLHNARLIAVEEDGRDLHEIYASTVSVTRSLGRTGLARSSALASPGVTDVGSGTGRAALVSRRR